MQKIKHFFTTLHFTTPVAIIVAALILASSHVVYGIIVSKGTQVSTVTMFAGRNLDDSDFITGNTKSNVFVVEYSDTECPFCAQLSPTIKKLKETYASKIGFVYRYFPLTQIHPHSFEESKAIYCVGKNLGASKREEYISNIFGYKYEKQNMVFPDGEKELLAKNLGVDQQAFNTCMQSQESSDAINASIQDGITAGVQGTPASFVLIKNKKGYEVAAFIDGARPYEYFKAVIDDALSR